MTTDSGDRNTSKCDPVIRLAARTGAGERAEDMEYAVLSLTIDVALALLKKIGVAGVFGELGDGFHRVSYFYCAVDYYQDIMGKLQDLPDLSDDDYATLENDIDNCCWAEIPEVDLGDATRTDCDMVKVDATSVIFTAYQKHCGDEVETNPIMQYDLAKLTNKLMGMRAASLATEAGNGREHRSIQLDAD